MNASEIVHRQASLEEIHSLRVAVLRPGQSVLKFPNDGAPAPTTWHFGSFALGPASERNIACVTYLASTYKGKPAIQLRGMAVDEAFRSQGVGGALIGFAEGVVTAKGPRILWCNARVRAMAFYARHGWRSVSEEFDVPGIGPHRVMLKEL